jgi:hypothetical protein
MPLLHKELRTDQIEVKRLTSPSNAATPEGSTSTLSPGPTQHSLY